jgi:hypothetical protein
MRVYSHFSKKFYYEMKRQNQPVKRIKNAGQLKFLQRKVECQCLLTNRKGHSACKEVSELPQIRKSREIHISHELCNNEVTACDEYYEISTHFAQLGENCPKHRNSKSQQRPPKYKIQLTENMCQKTQCTNHL